MIAVTVLCVFIVAWVIDRAALRRRLDNLERELHALTRSRVQRTGDTPAESPPPAASDLAVPASLPARRESEPTAAPSSNRPTIRVAPQPEKPAPTAGQTPALRLWQLISGGNPIVRFGVIILFFGVAFLLRYAAEHSHLTIEDRLIGVAIGALALLGLGWYWRRSHHTFAMALLGGGVGVLYLTVFTAYRNYSLLSPTAAFALLAAVGGLSAVLSILLDSMAFAALGTIGGYLAPVLAATPHADHVALFSYYALLDLVVAGIAWYRSWRPLNLIAFGFTYGVGTAWGVLHYGPQDFHTSEPFLILFFLLFAFIAVAFALSRAAQHNYYVDGTLVFGTPTATMALQAGMLHNVPYALAWTALCLSAFYFLFAWALNRQRAPVRILVESFIALSLAFATLAIPLALEERWTGAAWALEGAAVLWIGLRQERRLAVLAGMVLQFAAAVAYLNDVNAGHIDRSGWAIANGNFISELLLTVGALFSAARLRQRVPEWLVQWQGISGGALFLMGLAWWLHAGGAEVMRDDIPSHWQHDWLALGAGSALGLSLLGARLQWNAPRLAALALFPALAAFALTETAEHPFAFEGWWIWPLAFAAAYWTLRRDESTVSSWVRTWLHALGLWLLSAIAAHEVAWQLSQSLPDGPAWSRACWGMLPALLLIAASRGSRSQRWPFAQESLGYGELGPLVLGLYLTLWNVLCDVASDGTARPLPYVPLLNPIDLAQAVAIIALIFALKSAPRFRTSGESSDLRTLFMWAIALQAFFLINAMMLRFLHHYVGIAYDLDSMQGSTLVQTCLTILWTLIALTTMVWANREARRVAWISGAVLLGIVILKLFTVDLSSSGTLPRIVSFLGVGAMMLVIGFFSPLPPRGAEPRS
jgi:uncharacterized membrane protein